MQATVHLLTGAALAVLVPNPTALVPLAIFSHYVLDLLPHIDPETFAEVHKPYTLRQKLALITDVVLVVTLLAAFYFLRNDGAIVLLGAVSAQLPDLLIPLEQYYVLRPLRMVHYQFHWRESRAQEWSWYIAGLVIPMLISAGALFVIAYHQAAS